MTDKAKPWSSQRMHMDALDDQITTHQMLRDQDSARIAELERQFASMNDVANTAINVTNEQSKRIAELERQLHSMGEVATAATTVTYEQAERIEELEALLRRALPLLQTHYKHAAIVEDIEAALAKGTRQNWRGNERYRN